jgi:hypothetical protein
MGLLEIIVIVGASSVTDILSPDIDG